MSPREVDELSNDELAAFTRYMRKEHDAIRKANARRGKR